MPVNPDAVGYGQSLAQQNAACEAEVADLMRRQQTLAASNDTVTPVPARFRDAVAAARSRLDQAEAAYTIAEQQAYLRIRMERPSDSLAKLWFEEGTLAASRERQAAREALGEAEIQLGRQVEYRQHLQRLEAAAPGRRADAQDAYQAALDQIDVELRAARLRCAVQ